MRAVLSGLIFFGLVLSGPVLAEPERQNPLETESLRETAIAGSSVAQLQLGIIWKDKFVVQIMDEAQSAEQAALSFDTAVDWLERALASETAPETVLAAGEELAGLYQLQGRDSDLKKLRDQGVPAAMRIWADRQNWKEGQYPKAMYWYERAAQGGDTNSMMILAQKYGRGWGIKVKMDTVRTLFWTEAAANAGRVSAMYETALIYERGFGDRAPDFELDPQEARDWLLRAATKGHTDAEIRAIRLFLQTKEYESALPFINSLLNKENTEGRFLAGIFYENGYAVEMDEKLALAFYHVAADDGHAVARRAVQTLEANQ